jgi:heptosyltransferase-2
MLSNIWASIDNSCGKWEAMPEPLPPPVVVFKDLGLGRDIALVNDLPSRDDIRRILIIKWGGMGDVVISTAIIEDVCRAFPGRDIHLNAMPPWDVLFADDPRFSRVWVVDLRNRERNAKGMWRWVKTARAANYDLIIDLQCNDRTRVLLSALLLSGCRIPWRIGNMAGFPYNISHPKLPSSTHDFQRMRASLLAAGIPANTEGPLLHNSERHRKRAYEILDESGVEDGRFAVFLPGSHAAGLTKRWGVHNYRRLAQLLMGAGLKNVVLLGGPDEVEECAAIAEGEGGYVVNLCRETQLLELPTIFQRAALIVANDTGTAHLAAASNQRMIVICGPTDPRRVKPVGKGVIAIQADLPCKNCYRKTCGHHSCMKFVTPEQVMDFAKSVAEWIPAAAQAGDIIEAPRK